MGAEAGPKVSHFIGRRARLLRKFRNKPPEDPVQCLAAHIVTRLFAPELWNGGGELNAKLVLSKLFLGLKMDQLNEAIFLENHNILPAQLFPRRRGSAEMEPLRRLALALLLDALHIFQANFDATSRRCKRDFDEAREWLFGEPGSGPFALENVCFLLDIDPSRLRRWLGLWQSMKRAGRPCRVLRRGAVIRLNGPIRPRSIIPKEARRLAGTIACPSCSRHGEMLKPSGRRLNDKVFSAKLFL